VSTVFVGRHSCGGVASAIVATIRTVHELSDVVRSMESDGLAVEAQEGTPSAGEWCKCFDDDVDEEPEGGA
jgi:hypothetical protein